MTHNLKCRHERISKTHLGNKISAEHYDRTSEETTTQSAGIKILTP